VVSVIYYGTIIMNIYDRRCKWGMSALLEYYPIDSAAPKKWGKNAPVAQSFSL